MSKLADDFIAAVIRDVAELPDRNSPADEPEMMLVTAAELRVILRERLMAVGLREAEPDQLHRA